MVGGSRLCSRIKFGGDNCICQLGREQLFLFFFSESNLCNRYVSRWKNKTRSERWRPEEKDVNGMHTKRDGRLLFEHMYLLHFRQWTCHKKCQLCEKQVFLGDESHRLRTFFASPPLSSHTVTDTRLRDMHDLWTGLDFIIGSLSTHKYPEEEKDTNWEQIDPVIKYA